MLGIRPETPADSAAIRSVNEEAFGTSESICSFTYETKCVLRPWFGNKQFERALFVDTPGLGDTEGRDT